jgi:hypothetical protein
MEAKSPISSALAWFTRRTTVAVGLAVVLFVGACGMRVSGSNFPAFKLVASSGSDVMRGRSKAAPAQRATAQAPEPAASPVKQGSATGREEPQAEERKPKVAPAEGPAPSSTGKTDETAASDDAASAWWIAHWFGHGIEPQHSSRAAAIAASG